MRPAALRAGLLLGGLVLAIVSVGAAYLVSAWPEQGDAARLDIASSTGARVVGVRAGTAYAYLVELGEALVLVDAGGDPEGAALRAELGARGRDVAAVDAVLLTHAHRDHHAAAALFEDAPVFLGEADHVVLRGDRLPEGVLERLLTRIRKKPRLPRTVRTVVAGERLRFGELTFDVVGTPGHTPGSVMYLLGDLLFSGDGLLADGEGVKTPPWFVSSDAAGAVTSLVRLVPLPFVGLADGHRGYTADGKARLLRHLDALQ